ncbi:hypothetical protein [Alkaliphilus flagellatus]|nr:hypothetical protein [Alkaliphilus flagellatus]
MTNTMQDQMNTPVGQGSKKLDSDNLKVLEDQLNHESLMTKKCTNYASYCTDTELKNLCQQASQKHKQHYNELLNYLNSHQ